MEMGCRNRGLLGGDPAGQLELVDMKVYVITSGNHFLSTYKNHGLCTARAKAEQYVEWFNSKLAVAGDHYIPRRTARIEVYDTEDIVDSSRWNLKKPDRRTWVWKKSKCL